MVGTRGKSMRRRRYVQAMNELRGEIRIVKYVAKFRVRDTGLKQIASKILLAKRKSNRNIDRERPTAILGA